MVVSIIIVNYNVKYFLEQCLYSVVKAIDGITAEVFVVDNNSTDNSLAYLEPKFPTVHFIANTTNEGFGKANNKALQYCNGDYILYLNPDTIVSEDCIDKCVFFFEAHADCGALGVRMIDGSGIFLPESKRAFPSPAASFFKLTGLAKFFPHSKIFNQYALGHFDEHQTHEVDVLAGAFLMAQRSIIEACKGFDEVFFMYGEDIDLSYRIQKMGYKNYYFPQTSIIHFKGESLKRGSLNHVRLFYGAMGIFVKKHYNKGRATLFSFFMQLAINLRAIVSLLKTFLRKIGLPFLDALIIFSSLLLIKKGWIVYERDGEPFHQSPNITLLMFTGIYLLASTLSGMYDRLYKPAKALLSSITGIVVMIAAYALIPEPDRFSRGVIVIGGLLAGLMVSFFRWVLVKLKLIDNFSENDRVQQTIIVGDETEYAHVMDIYSKAGVQDKVLGRISLGMESGGTIGSIHQLHQLLIRMKIKEVVFCEGTLTYYQIIQKIQTLPHNISYRFISSKSNSIVGSDSKATIGETFTAEGFYQINQPYHKRMKRVADFFVSLFIIFTFPVHLLFIKNGGKAIKNALSVLVGSATWVGYSIQETTLPPLKENILTCYGLPVNAPQPLNTEALHQLDVQYARYYDCWQDVVLLLENYKQLGG